MVGKAAPWVRLLLHHICLGCKISDLQVLPLEELLTQVFCSWVWDRWVMMGGIGFTVGLIGFLLYTLIGIFGAIKYNTVR